MYIINKSLNFNIYSKPSFCYTKLDMKPKKREVFLYNEAIFLLILRETYTYKETGNF